MLEQGYWMHSNKPIVLILSGGASSRFGSPKALAKYNGETFLDIIVSKCLSLDLSIYTVLNPNLDKKISFDRPFTTIIGDSRCDMYHSLIRALNFIKDFSYVLIWPIDHPLVKVSTVEEIIKYHDKDNFIIPSYQSRLGHPILFPKSALKDIPLCNNLKELTLRIGRKLVVVEDEGILKNINTKKDLTYE